MSVTTVMMDTDGVPWRVQGVAGDVAGEGVAGRGLVGWDFIKRIMGKLGGSVSKREQGRSAWH